jgi:hypothetical protein
MTAGRAATSAVYEYGAYNLRIRSHIELPEFPAPRGGEDFEIRLESWPGVPGTRSISWQEEPEFEARFDYPGLARFVVRAGREVIISAAPGGDPEIFRLYVQGMMLAAALYQRGLFVLHSSVVDLGGYAIGFTGVVGAGKSTLATAFRARGYKILADDNAALDVGQAGRSAPPSAPLVWPAFPSLKVYPAVARSLGVEPSALRPMHVSQVKQAHAVSDAFAPDPLPLRAVYVLDRDFQGPPARIPPVASVKELIRHSVPTRWGVAGNARHLRLCARLAGMAPLFRLGTFQDLAEIPGIASTVERHAATHMVWGRLQSARAFKPDGPIESGNPS